MRNSAILVFANKQDMVRGSRNLAAYAHELLR